MELEFKYDEKTRSILSNDSEIFVTLEPYRPPAEVCILHWKGRQIPFEMAKESLPKSEDGRGRVRWHLMSYSISAGYFDDDVKKGFYKFKNNDEVLQAVSIMLKAMEAYDGLSNMFLRDGKIIIERSVITESLKRRLLGMGSEQVYH